MNKQIFIVLGVCLVFVSCKQLTKATDFITQPTAKEIYARDFEDTDVVFNTWAKNFEVSKNDSLKINLPSGISSLQLGEDTSDIKRMDESVIMYFM